MILAAALAVGACAMGVILKSNEVNTAALLQGDSGQQKFNVIRFVTYGPVADQVFGYFLYREGIEVVTGGGTFVVYEGKMTLAEVLVDYNKVLKSSLHTASGGLSIREIFRGDSVAGYIAADHNIDVSIWDITPAGKESGAVVQLVYNDARGQHGVGTYRGRSMSGD
jgi:hypothetical protein